MKTTGAQTSVLPTWRDAASPCARGALPARGYWRAGPRTLETIEGNEASERVASKAGFVPVERYQADHRASGLAQPLDTDP